MSLALAVNPPWYVYASTPAGGGRRALELDTSLPEGVQPLGEWIWPKPKTVFEGYEARIYTGEHVFKRQLRVTDGAGSGALRVRMTYQACNPEFCGPVQQEELSVELNVAASGAKPDRATARTIAGGVTSTTGSTMPALGEVVSGTPLDMRFTALDNRTIDIKELRGKVVLIDFWAMWCVPCVAELPNVKAVYEKYRSKGFEVVGVNFDHHEDREKLMKFIAARGLNWPHRFDGKGFEQSDQRAYGIQGIPATFLVDREGKLAQASVKGPALQSAVEILLAAQ